MGEAIWKGILYKTDTQILGKTIAAPLELPCKGNIL